LNESDLEALSDVRRVTQYVYIDTPKVKSLRFLRNLELIDGRRKLGKYSLRIGKTYSLAELGLRKLKRIADGGVAISDSSNLCYADTLPWTKIVKTNDVAITGTRNASECGK
jgi:hypothetical protein